MPIEDETVDLDEIRDIVNDIHLPEHTKLESQDFFDDFESFEQIKPEIPATPPSPPSPSSATINGENIVKGHLVTLRQKDGKENVYFLDPQGQLHPVIGAQLRSPVANTTVVKVSNRFWLDTVQN